MAIKFTTTENTNPFIRALVYGQSGVGKTRLTETLDKPVVLSSENKLLSLKHKKIPVVIGTSLEDFQEIVEKIKIDNKFAQFKSLVVDSASDIAERILTAAKIENPDGRQAYGFMNDSFIPFIKSLWDIEKDLYVICKQKLTIDEISGLHTFAPMLPGREVPAQMPYMFDYVFAYRNTGEEGKTKRFLQTQGCLQYTAKGSDKLQDEIFDPKLQQIFETLRT